MMDFVFLLYSFPFYEIGLLKGSRYLPGIGIFCFSETN